MFHEIIHFFSRPFIRLDCVYLFSFQVHDALEIVDEMCEMGLTLTIATLHSLLHASEESYDFNLVRCMFHSMCEMIFWCTLPNMLMLTI